MNEIIEYLKTESLMTFTSSDNREIWSASVYYFVDEYGCLYFSSSNTSKHIILTEINRLVACAIADTSQKSSADKKGVQLQGQISVVNDKADIQWFIKKWKERHGIPKFTIKDLFTTTFKSRIYKITPIQIKFMDTRDISGGYLEWKRS